MPTVTRRFPASVLAPLALAAAAWLPGAAQAASLVLDTFDAPTPASTAVAFGAPGSASASPVLLDFTPTVPGGVRQTTFNVYGNPLDSASVVSVGGGLLRVAQGVGAKAETIISYGAFTRPTGDPLVGGPRFGLDLTPYNAMRLDLTGVEDTLNVNITYYSSAPLPGGPLYYISSGINVAPASSGAPLSFELPIPVNPLFNLSQVDGIVVLFNRSGPTPHTSYNLDTLTLVTSVPEPQTWALFLAGGAVLGWVGRRRRA